MSYLSFYCESQAISNARLKSRTCSDRLQNFIFVQWELAPDEAVKWSDPFHDSEKNGAAECVLACEDKSSIKFSLLPWKGNKSKWHSTQILFNTYVTIFIHTAFIKCLRLVWNIYSKWLTHRFRHFSNSAKGVLALLIISELETNVNLSPTYCAQSHETAKFIAIHRIRLDMNVKHTKSKQIFEEIVNQISP